MQRLQLVNQAISQESPIYDFIVIGTGISGMQAADILTSKPNNKVLILQAQTTLGGRIGSLSVGDLAEAKRTPWIWKNINHFRNINIEIGATWIEERHYVILQLCKQFGITVREQHALGKCNYVTPNRSFSSEQIMNHPDYAQKIKEVVKIIDDISEEYNNVVFSDLSLTSQKAKDMLRKYDGQNLQQFLKQVICQKYSHVRELFDVFFEHTECVSCEENSVHQMLTKNARSNDLGILKEFLGDFGHEPSFLINGGSDLLIQNFALKIQRNIKNSLDSILRLGQQVFTIDNRRKDFITIICEDTFDKSIKKYRCKQVICAVPLAVSRMITFTNLSLAKKIIIDNQLHTNAVKSFFITKKPFWRKHKDGSLNYNGDTLFSNDFHVNMCHDISPTDESCGILVFFHSGKRLDAWESKFPSNDECQNQKKKEYLIKLVGKAFGVKKQDEAELFDQCIYYQASYMENQFIRSGFQSNSRPGTFNSVLNCGDSLDAYYRDENGIVFVGSQYSLQYASYMQGALRITRQKLFKLIGEKDPLAHLLIQNSDFEK